MTSRHSVRDKKRCFVVLALLHYVYLPLDVFLGYFRALLRYVLKKETLVEQCFATSMKRATIHMTTEVVKRERGKVIIINRCLTIDRPWRQLTINCVDSKISSRVNSER